jgi:hypothetical protein
MSDYRYKIGQRVTLRTAGCRGAPTGAYHIVERLPAQVGRPRYLISSLEHDGYMTVANEGDLRKFSSIKSF